MTMREARLPDGRRPRPRDQRAIESEFEAQHGAVDAGLDALLARGRLLVSQEKSRDMFRGQVENLELLIRTRLVKDNSPTAAAWVFLVVNVAFLAYLYTLLVNDVHGVGHALKSLM